MKQASDKHWLRPEGALAFVAAPTVWALHFVAVYGLSGVACVPPGSGQQQAVAPGWLTPALALTTMAAVLAVALLGLRAHRSLERPAADAVGPHGPVDASVQARKRTMAWIAGATAVVAAIAIGLSGLAMLMLPACER